MNTRLKPVWAGSDLRLDPFRLPQAVSYAARDDLGDVLGGDDDDLFGDDGDDDFDVPSFLK